MANLDGLADRRVVVTRTFAAPRRLTYTDTFGSRDGVCVDGAPELHVEIAFEDDGDGTPVTMSTSFDSTEARDQVLVTGAMAGWNQTLDRLTAHLADIMRVARM